MYITNIFHKKNNYFPEKPKNPTANLNEPYFLIKLK